MTGIFYFISVIQPINYVIWKTSKSYNNKVDLTHIIFIVSTSLNI